MWDGEYDGLFVRQFAGQTASQPGTGAQTSPDIISSGVAPAQDASAYTSSGAYNSTTLANAVVTGVPNFIYLRVINPNNRAQRARVYVFLGDNAAPSLSALSNSEFTVAGQTQNWVDLEADTQNEVLVSTVPIVWCRRCRPPQSSQQFLLTCVDGSTDPQPPDFSTVGYGQLSAVKVFVATQPQLSWATITNTPPNPAPTFTTQFELSIDKAGTYYVGTTVAEHAGRRAFTVGVPGPDGRRHDRRAKLPPARSQRGGAVEGDLPGRIPVQRRDQLLAGRHAPRASEGDLRGPAVPVRGKRGRKQAPRRLTAVPDAHRHIQPCSAQHDRRGYPAPFRVILKAAGRNEFRILRTDHSQPRL